MICDIKTGMNVKSYVLSLTAKDMILHVYIEFVQVADSITAQRALTGRLFNGKPVVATYFLVNDYQSQDSYINIFTLSSALFVL